MSGGRRDGRAGTQTPSKILVVEDEQIVALELKDRLTRMGHSVVGVVVSGEEAIEHVRRLLPDLVLMDIKLQGKMDGIEAAEIIRSEADIPVVYLTAFADETTLQRAKLTEPYGYILKPFQERELHVIIEMSLYRHRVARELREAEAFRSALLQSVGDGVVATGPDGRVKFLNPLAEDLTGWREKEAVGRPLDEVFNVVQLPERRSGTWKDVTSKKLIARDGSEHPIEAEFTTIVDATNAALGTVWAFRDISERKHLEDRQCFMTVASGEVSSSLDREMILAKLAPLIAHNLADWCVIHLSGEQGGLRVAAFAHRDPQKHAWAPQLVGGIVCSKNNAIEIQNVVRSGSSVFEANVATGTWIATALGIRSAPELLASSAIIVALTTRGQTLGTLSLVSEHTDRPFTEFDLAFAEELGRRIASGIDNAQLYSDAQRAIRLREDVLAIVSHDLKNPLACISMNADQLLYSPDKIDPQRVTRNAQAIRRNVERMNRLIGDLLDVASIDGGRLSLELKPHRVRGLIAETLSMFEAQASERSIRLLSTSFPDVDDVDLLCDRERVLQVLSNLIGNALKFSFEGRSIALQGEVRGRVVQFSVSDEAAGIAPDQVEHIFERYWQAPDAQRKGSGLGLYIAKGIVDTHGGRIWVDSTPGRGSTFYFTIPLAERAEEQVPLL